MIRLRAVLGLLLLTGPAHADRFNWEGQVEVDAADLTSQDAKKRVDAVRLLAQDDISLSQRFLIKALADQDFTVRTEAAKALGLGQSQLAAGPMIEWLGDTDPRIRAVAAEALGEIGGQEATSALTRSLGDADPAVRQRAVKALGKIGMRGNPNVVVALIPRLEDDKSDVRRETVDQLEQLGDKRAVIPLVSRFNDTSREVVRAAVRAVGKLGDKSAVPALIRLMSDTDEGVRTAAVGSLGQLGATEAIDALTEQLGAGVMDAYRGKVAFALGQIAAAQNSGRAGEDAMKALVETLATSASNRSYAKEALRVAGKAAVPALVAHLAGRIKGDPTTAVTLLADSGDARATAVLTAELERGRVAMPLVLKALGATHDPDALVPVLGAVANKDAAIRLAAMEALRPLLGSDARAGDVLLERLDDDDLEVRILAAEYLGNLQVVAATQKLTGLAGPGNPERLRHAAIDALGEIEAVKPNPQASALLVGVLKEGPTALHLPAAAALAHANDPSALPALITLAESDRGPTRHEVVRAIGGVMRGRPDPNGRKTLRMLAQDANVKTAVAAIAGLAAANDPGDTELLRRLVAEGAADRRRAAAWALGEMHDVSAIPVLTDVLGIHDDRLVGDAAWALGEIAVAQPAKIDGKLLERFGYLAGHGGWAAAIDASAALARAMQVMPREQRTAQKATLVKLAYHKSRLVRINVALALGTLTGDDEATKSLATLAKNDASPHVRAAAVDALVRIGTKSATEALAQVQKLELDVDVRAKITDKPAARPPRNEWRNLYVVDVGADEARVRQEPFFIHTDDGLVWASYTDARGELTTEHAPASLGPDDVWAASRETEY
ncbi:MAG: HEAT repeat domain-containing protein [Kofleriaceae bacterium]